MRIEPMVHDPKETKVDFGATVSGVDLNELDGESSLLVRETIGLLRTLAHAMERKAWHAEAAHPRDRPC